MKLQGQVAIVTGGASGIGYSFVKRFLHEGSKVIIADIAYAEQAAATLGNATNCLGITTDVTSQDGLTKMLDGALAAFGQVDVLVNNAAVSSTLELKPFEETSLDEWRGIFEVNVYGTFLACRAVSGYMRARGQGRIINLTSGTAFKGTPFMLPYLASKGAIISMTRALANELGNHNITVNAIAPGFTATEAMKKNAAFYGAAKDVAITTRALKREATAEDIVGAAVFLASADSAFITGQILTVDGGSVYH